MPVTPPPPWVADEHWYRPVDRRREVGVAGRRPHVEQLLGRELAVEDVAADQPVVVLHLVRADHLPVDDRLLEVRRELGVAVDDAVGVGVELGVVRLVAHVCGTHCVNSDMTCVPSGHSVGSTVDGITPSENGWARRSASRASWNACAR